MRVLSSVRFLGLAFAERSIRAAEVCRDGTVVRFAEFAFPPEVSLEDPEALGDRLQDFLRHHRFTASRAIAGLPARWLLARGREIPPMSAVQAGEALRIQAEGDLSMDLDDLVLDYAGDADPREARRVFLVAVLERHLDRVLRACRAAGLRLRAVTSTALSLGRAAGDGLRDGILVSLSPGFAEVLFLKDGAPGALRHFSINGIAPPGAGGGPGKGSLSALGNEIRRELTLAPRGPAPAEVLLWDGLGVDGEEISSFGERVGLPVRVAGLESLGARTGPEPGEPVHRGSGAVSLALASARKDLLAVDFIHSRCSPPRKRRWGRRTAALTGLAAVLVLGGLYLFIDLDRRESELEGLKDRLQSMKPDLQEAEAFVKNNKSLVLGWYDARPHPLEVLKRVTLAFPEEGTVWATAFSATEGQKGTISGKAVDQKGVLGVLDRLKADRGLTDVMLSDMREAGGGSKVVSFALTFTYHPPVIP